MMKPKTAALLLLFLLTFPLTGTHADEAPEFRIIVNARNPVSNLDKRFVADVYLKKIKHWPSDGVIQPVDLKPSSPIRRLFSEDVLDRPVMSVRSYWEQLIFSGTDVPPPELGSGQDVIKYVSQHPESIGYVSSFLLAGASGVKPIDLE